MKPAARWTLCATLALAPAGARAQAPVLRGTGGLGVIVERAAGSVLVIVTYVAQILGPVLKWPRLVLEANPFHYLRTVPVNPFNVGGFVGVTLVGLVIGALGAWRYARRDLVS